MEKNHPGVLELAHIHRAMFHSTSEKQLEAVWETVVYAVPDDHKELPLLNQAFLARQAEIREQAAREAADQMAKDEAAQLIIRETDDNVRRFSQK